MLPNISYEPGKIGLIIQIGGNAAQKSPKKLSDIADQKTLLWKFQPLI